MTRGETLNTDNERLQARPGDGDVRTQRSPRAMQVCIVGASGKLGRYMVQHALDRGYEVVGVCREESVGNLDAFKGRITIVPGATDDREVIKRAVAGCDAVLIVLVPLIEIPGRGSPSGQRWNSVTSATPAKMIPRPVSSLRR